MNPQSAGKLILRANVVQIRIAGRFFNDMSKNAQFQAAILLYPGVTALDAVGPSEVFSRMPDTEVRFVGKEIGPVPTKAVRFSWLSPTR